MEQKNKTYDYNKSPPYSKIDDEANLRKRKEKHWVAFQHKDREKDEIEFIVLIDCKISLSGSIDQETVLPFLIGIL